MSVKSVRALVKQTPTLQSKQFKTWLDEVIFELDDISLSRREVASLTETPCTNAAGVLHRACRRMHINSTDRLFDVGLAGLDRIKGVGERAEWIAACILYLQGYDVDIWTQRKQRGARTTRGAIRLVASTRKQKHE